MSFPKINTNKIKNTVLFAELLALIMGAYSFIIFHEGTLYAKAAQDSYSVPKAHGR